MSFQEKKLVAALCLILHKFCCDASMKKPQSETTYLTLNLILEYVLLTSLHP